MSIEKIFTLYKNDNVELILNQRKNQIALMDRGLCEALRKADNYDSLRDMCKIDNSKSLIFDNTYRYLLINDYVLFSINEKFNKRVYQWQDEMINVASKATDIINSQKMIMNDDLLINDLILLWDNNIDLINSNFEFDSQMYTISKKIVAWISIDNQNLESRMQWIFEHYNDFDDITIIVCDGLDLQLLSRYLFKDTNNKISYQLFISDFLQYRNTWNLFYELGNVICFSSRVFCLYSKISSNYCKDSTMAINMIKNSVYCLSSVNESEEIVSEAIFPYTINTSPRDYIYDSTTLEVYLPESACHNSDCCFNTICLYQYGGCDCEYRKMMADLIGIEL